MLTAFLQKEVFPNTFAMSALRGFQITSSTNLALYICPLLTATMLSRLDENVSTEIRYSSDHRAFFLLRKLSLESALYLCFIRGEYRQITSL